MKLPGFIALLLTICTISIYAQSNNSSSPYFLLPNENLAQHLVLASTSADVNILGPIADVNITQEYQNLGDIPLEAVYVFPASTRAAVYKMEMRIGDRTIKAKIEEKNKARAEYEAAKQSGKRASLLEQHRPNVFQMNVANILPGEKIIVSLRYTEFLMPENQIYSFVYPSVVGPRYTDQNTTSFTNMPYQKSGEVARYEYNINVQIQTPIAIQSLSSSSHRIVEKKYSDDHSTVNLDIAETNPGDRDFILAFQLTGNNIATGIKTFNSGNEKFFLAQIEPPSLSSIQEISPREYIFIIDVSGSMKGFPLNTSKQLMRNLLHVMRPTDKFNILFFAGNAFSLSPSSLNATPENIKMAFAKMNSQKGGGSTQILPAIKKAMKFEKEKGFSRSFVIITDGYVSVEEEVFSLISKNLNRANFFAFGIGSNVNRHLIEGLAHVGRGEPFIVTKPSEAERTAAKLKSYIENPVLTDIEIKGTHVKLYDIIPESTPDLMAARPIYFFGKYENNEGGSLTITGKQGKQKFEQTIRMPEASSSNNALKYLWAREKLRFLSDFNTLRMTEKRIEEITSIGLAYNLLTAYTSFVAIDDEIVNSNGKPKLAKQVLPMPQGVSNNAIGFQMQLNEVIDQHQNSIVVDITCADIALKIIIECLLEKVFTNRLSQHEIASLTGKHWIFSYKNNKISSHQSSNLEQLIIDELNKELIALSYKQVTSSTINIHIK